MIMFLFNLDTQIENSPYVQDVFFRPAMTQMKTYDF